MTKRLIAMVVALMLAATVAVPAAAGEQRPISAGSRPTSGV